MTAPLFVNAATTKPATTGTGLMYRDPNTVLHLLAYDVKTGELLKRFECRSVEQATTFAGKHPEWRSVIQEIDTHTPETKTTDRQELDGGEDCTARAYRCTTLIRQLLGSTASSETPQTARWKEDIERMIGQLHRTGYNTDELLAGYYFAKTHNIKLPKQLPRCDACGCDLTAPIFEPDEYQPTILYQFCEPCHTRRYPSDEELVALTRVNVEHVVKNDIKDGA